MRSRPQSSRAWPSAHRATVKVLGPRGERAVDASDLFVTHFTTSLAPGEIITSVEIPVLSPRQGSCFLELARRPGDFAMVNVAVLATLADDGPVRDCRVIVGATSDRPVDHSDSARALHGELLDERVADEAARAVARDVAVGPSSHAGADYRRELVAVLVKRALLAAGAAARGSDCVGGRP